jgi:hypothetical protein
VRRLIPLLTLVGLVALSAGAAAAEPRRLADHPKERGLYNADFRRDAKGRVLSENRLSALKAACELPVDASMRPAPAARPGLSPLASFPGTVWRQIGPLPATGPKRKL